MKRTKFYCQCGCCEIIKPGSKYISGHNLKIDRNKREYHPLSKEHKRKISERHSGKIVSEETRTKIRNVNIGKKLSDEHKRNISKAKIGIKLNLSEVQLEKLKKRSIGQE